MNLLEELRKIESLSFDTCLKLFLRDGTEIRGGYRGFVSALDNEQGVSQISVLSDNGVMYVVDEDQIEAIKEV